MPTEEDTSKADRWLETALQLIGAVWTLIYAAKVFSFEHSHRGDMASFWFSLVIFWIPNVCMLLAFAFLRTGGAFAFLVLALATWLQLTEEKADLMGLPQAMSMFVMLVGGPVALFRADYVYRRRNRTPDNDS